MDSSAQLDPAVCEQARLSRDPRFDGRFFIGVRSTGVFCRPVCPVRLPKPENVRFFPDAAAASEAGYRPCLRCRPELAPDSPHWPWQPPLVQAALQMVESDLGLSSRGIAARLGVSERHLRRLFAAHVGTSPSRVIQTRRLLFAKRLITDSPLPLRLIAGAAGYGSQRRFNAAIRATYGRAPSALRKRQPAPDPGFRLALRYRPPFDWAGLLAFFQARALSDVERIDGTTYQRSFEMFGQVGDFTLGHEPRTGVVQLRIQHPDPRVLYPVAARCRQMFDLDALPEDIREGLNRDAALAPALRGAPGLRVPGAWDLFELCVRAVLGQQITVAAASGLASRLARRFGPAVTTADGAGLRLFPGPQALATAPIEELGLPRRRAQCLRELGARFASGELPAARHDLADFCTRLSGIAGIGPWTIAYIRMRGLRDPDAFPAGDIVLRRHCAAGGQPLSARELEIRSAAWRPWRAYAALALWRTAGAFKP